MGLKNPHELETDPRYPSGPWVGFFMQSALPPGKHSMELELTFCKGRLTGEGRDRLGEFTFDGVYDLATGKCEWRKQYTGKHAVDYKGFNEGKGIWGKWELMGNDGDAHGGFHIWPVDIGEVPSPTMSEQAEIPREPEMGELAPAEVGEPEFTGTGVESAASEKKAISN